MARMSSTAAALLAAAVWGWASTAAAVEIATVAKNGDQAPGAGGAAFLSFRVALANGAGDVAFQSQLDSIDTGIWVSGPAGLALVAKTGDLAPGAGGGRFRSINDPVLNGAGATAFLGSAGDLTTSRQGVWAGPPGGLALIALEGQVVPGTGGATISDFGNPVLFTLVLNGAGQVAFRANIGSGGFGIWRGGLGGLALVARNGDLAPGAGGAVFTEFGDPVLNGAGEVAIRGILNGGGQGIWLGGPGGLTLVAKAGDPAPGAGGATFIGMLKPVLNGAGEVTFLGSLSDGGSGIWRAGPAGFAPVVKTGDPAPGSGGATFTSVSGQILNGAGEVAFVGNLSGGGRGIWLGGPDGLILVTKNGDLAPGAGGATFMTFGSPVLNGAGEVAFFGLLTGGGVTAANDAGIWAGRAGALQPIVRKGDEVEVAPGLFKTVASNGLNFVGNSGNEDGRPSGFGEGGQLAFFAGFTDSSQGVFLAVPEAPTVHHLAHRPIGGAWDQVILPKSFKMPVIIAGPPGLANKAPGVVRLRRIDGAKGHFEARFQEWRYLNGRHPEERVDFLALERGRHVQADGSIWEAGTVRVKGNRRWKKQRFSPRFPGVPRIFATVQSVEGKTAVAARVRKVTRKGFEVSIQEEEKDLGSRHPKETVGYLAVYSPGGQGTIAGGVDGTDYRMNRTKLNRRFKTVPGGVLKLEEEKSQDKERRHKKEVVSVMTLGRGLFAQQASDKEADTTAIRRR